MNVFKTDTLHQLRNLTWNDRTIVAHEVTSLPSVVAFACNEKMHDIAAIILPIPNLVDDAAKFAVPIERGRRACCPVGEQWAVVAQANQKDAA